MEKNEVGVRIMDYFIIFLGLMFIGVSFWLVLKRGVELNFPIVAFCTLGILTMIVGWLEPDKISTPWGSIEKRVEKIEKNLRSYIVVGPQKKIIHSTFSKGEIEIINFIPKELALEFTFKKRPKYIEIRSNRGSDFFCKESIKNELYYFDCQALSLTTSELNMVIIEGYFGP